MRAKEQEQGGGGSARYTNDDGINEINPIYIHSNYEGRRRIEHK